MLNDDTKNMLDDFFDKEYASAKKFEQLALFKQSYKSAPALALMMLTHIDVDEHELLKVISNDLDITVIALNAHILSHEQELFIIKHQYQFISSKFFSNKYLHKSEAEHIIKCSITNLIDGNSADKFDVTNNIIVLCGIIAGISFTLDAKMTTNIMNIVTNTSIPTTRKYDILSEKIIEHLDRTVVFDYINNKMQNIIKQNKSADIMTILLKLSDLKKYKDNVSNTIKALYAYCLENEPADLIVFDSTNIFRHEYINIVKYICNYTQDSVSKKYLWRRWMHTISDNFTRLDTASQTYFFNYCVNSINASVGQVTLEHAINAIVTTAKYNEKSLAPELFDAIMAYSVLSEIKSGDE